MWGQNDDPRVKAELERKKKEQDRQKKIAKERATRALKAKEARKKKKEDDEKNAKDREEKRKKGEEEAEKAAQELLGEGGGAGTGSPQAIVPRLTRAGFGAGGVSWGSTNFSNSSRGAGTYVPPGANQPGVQQSGDEERYAHRQSAEPPSPPAMSNAPKLSRPF